MTAAGATLTNNGAIQGGGGGNGGSSGTSAGPFSLGSTGGNGGNGGAGVSFAASGGALTNSMTI